MSTNEVIHVGDLGYEFLLRITEHSTAVDVSGASSLSVYLRDPTGAVESYTASATTTGGITYTTTGTDVLHRPGPWSIYGKITGLSGWTGFSERIKFRVQPAPTT